MDSARFMSLVFGLLLAAASRCSAEEQAPRARELATGTGPAKVVAFSPDGKTLAAVDGRKVKLWDPSTGKLRRTLPGHEQPVRSAAFAPDGRTLATGARMAGGAESGGEVKVWDAESGKPKRALALEGSDVNALAFSPDGRLLVAGGLKGLWCWDAGTGELKHKMPSSAAVLALAFSPDGRTLASGAFDERVRLWDMTKWEVRQTLTGHRSEVRAMAFAPDGKTVASGGVGQLLIWDVRTGKQRRALKAETTVWAVSFSPDGKRLAAGYGDPKELAEGGVRVWDVASGDVRWSRAGRRGAMVSVAFSPDGKTLASGRYDGAVTLWDLSGKSKQEPGK